MLPSKFAKWQFLSILAVLLLDLIECKSYFGIGERIIHDQLILRDVLQARQIGVDKTMQVGFNYAIPEPITCIEIVSEQNVLAEVNFSYQHDLVKGIIITNNNVNGSNEDNETLLQPFEVEISIYGFNDTILNIDPAVILNRDQQFQGVLLPNNYIDHEDNEFDGNEYEDEDDEGDGDDEGEGDNEGEGKANEHEAHEDEENADEFDTDDKIIELGMRQKDDYLIYQTYQTSLESTQEPTNHTVVFYYIDSNFITYARFIIFDHTVDESSDDYQPPVAEYTHFSPNSLKATIFDSNTTNLFVQMQLYGYEPSDLPLDYKPFLASRVAAAATESPLTPLQRLRILMNQRSNWDEPNEPETGESNEILRDDMISPAKDLSTRSNWDSEEINFETGERIESSDNSTDISESDSSTRFHLNWFAVLNLFIVYILINY